jgi:hypothetical protein
MSELVEEAGRLALPRATPGPRGRLGRCADREGCGARGPAAPPPTFDITRRRRGAVQLG